MHWPRLFLPTLTLKLTAEGVLNACSAGQTFERLGCSYSERSRDRMRAFIAGLTLAIVIAFVINARARRRTRAERMPESVPEQPALSSRAVADVLNTATEEQLLSVYGIGPALAQQIILGRPYSSARELLERKIISANTFDNLRRELLEAS